MDKKKKIFISAYACEPWKGSEIGVGWHWVLEMSKYYELWVMTRLNNQKPIEQYLKEHPEEDYGIHFVYYDLPDKIKRFKKKMRGVRTYYSLWQIGSNSLVKKVMQDNDIHIYHLLTYGNALWGVSKYGQKQTFIWGPTGGLDIIEPQFARHYSVKSRCIEWTRRFIVKTLPYNIGFKSRCKNADLIICKAQSTVNAIPLKYKEKSIIFTDVAMDPIPNPPIKPTNNEILEYISVGRLDGWRGFDILIEAFAEALKENPNMRLKIIGKGIEQKKLSKKITNLKMQNNIILTGEISREQYQKEMKNCDVVVNSCLKEGGVTNAFDCMTWGKPFICIDTGGYTRNFDETCAIIIPRGSRKELVENLKYSIISMNDDKLRDRLSQAIIKKGQKITWEEKGREIEKLFESILKN